MPMAWYTVVSQLLHGKRHREREQ